MVIMQLTGIKKYYGAEEILSNIKLEIKNKDRIAIVGRNGAGKSTLLKIMAGEEPYDAGDIYKRRGLTIGYLSQHTGLDSDHTIWNEMLEVFHDLLCQNEELRQMEQKMAKTDMLSNSEYQQLLHEYDQLQHTFEEQGGYKYEAEIRGVLSGLKFHHYDDQTPINELSGGQKTRLALGKLLLTKPDLLILDEPTNHLDIDTILWLENYISSYPGAVVIVSHDRYFLDRTVQIVYEISRKKIKKYHGSYSKYLELRAKDYEQQLKEYEKQQTEIKKLEDFIQRNIVRASTTKRAQSRRKQLQKMEIIDKPLGDEASASFSFTINKQSGNDVLKLNHLSFKYREAEKSLFKNLSLQIHRGERIAIVGPNGIGKTTLLKLVVGRLQPESGEISLGTNVQIGYYDQELTELTSNKTVLNELWDDYPTENERDIRTILGNFLFTGDEVLKPVHALSGGEKARLALAKLMMQKANLLILDEPTNHLDLDSKEILEAALNEYPGTILFVSHDRYFINKIADQIVEMLPNKITIYLGDYDYYLQKKQELLELESLTESSTKSVKTDQAKLSFQEEKKRQSELRKIEREIAKTEKNIELLEAEHAAIEIEMTKREVYENHEKSLELMKQTESIQQKIEELMKEWEQLEEQRLNY